MCPIFKLLEMPGDDNKCARNIMHALVSEYKVEEVHGMGSEMVMPQDYQVDVGVLVPDRQETGRL